ncbi:MAG: DUF1326 domain-containing protein [Actinomycetota bacterium]
MDGDLDSYLPWQISGTYLEACNWARSPGRSPTARPGGVELAGMRTVLALRYDDDEPGSPWSFVLYVDERADRRQREALEGIFLGRLGGTPERQFPWVWKPSDLLGVRYAPIDFDHTPGRGWFRAGGQVTVRVREPVADQETVTCVIPGHHRSGREVVAEVLRVEDGLLEFELGGKCGYEATFDYSSDS